VIRTLTRRAFTGGCAACALAAGAHAEADGPVREAGYVAIGGVDQWIEVRGADRRNPVVLILHGGPGSTWEPFMDFFQPWEERFTLAYWSQRGAGRSFRRSGPAIAATMTIDRMAMDGVEVAEHLRSRFGQDRIVLLGHSWGTVLGVLMCQFRPDLVRSYVGTGQVVNTLAGEREGYRQVLARAHQSGRTDAVQSLEAMGEPPFDDIGKMVEERRWAGVFDTPSDAAFDAAWRNPSWFTQADAEERYKAWLFSNYLMWGDRRQDGPMMQIDFGRSATHFHNPMIFIQGTEDIVTPAVLVQDYERRMFAPHKALIRLEGGGHNAVFAMRDAFFEAMTRGLELA
jgi:pimeloyl-ACP methyl ester carboxylesterase